MCDLVIRIKKLPRWNDGIWLVLGRSIGIVTLRERKATVSWCVWGTPRTTFEDWRVGALNLSLRFLDTIEGPKQEWESEGDQHEPQ